MEEKSLKRIKSGLFDRGLSLTKFGIQSAAKMAHGGIKSILLDSASKEEHLKALLAGQAELLAKELGQLKGSLMKVGQMLALYGEHFLPDEVVISLKTLNEQSIALEWAEMERLVRERLGPDLYEELEIDPKPLAAASMGQVHKARIKATGEILCLKIQYPGVDTAIDSDIKAMRSMLAMFRMIPKHSEGFEALFQEIREMLHQELDYEQELAFTESAAEHLDGLSEYIVPRVFKRYSTRQILATSFEAGINFDSQEVLTLSEERRAKLADAYSRLFLRELFSYRMMQTDPHFGNYKVRCQESGDQLILLDWGAVRQFEEKFLDWYKELILGAIQADAERVIQSGIGIGFLRPEDPERLKHCFVEIAYIAIEPWLPPHDPRVPSNLVDKEGRYLWSKSDLPSRITSLAAKYALSFKMRPPPREVLFLDRKIGGVFIILKVLDARFHGHQILQEEILDSWGERFSRDHYSRF